MERLIYYRINSSITDTSLTENNWNATASSKKGVSGKNYNIFSEDTFSNIKFLKDTNPQVTSVGTVEGESLVYSANFNYYNQQPGWHKECSEGYVNVCARDMSHNISPVCRIVLTEAL